LVAFFISTRDNRDTERKLEVQNEPDAEPFTYLGIQIYYRKINYAVAGNK
jgi:hypothetical protein